METLSLGIQDVVDEAADVVGEAAIVASEDVSPTVPARIFTTKDVLFSDGELPMKPPSRRYELLNLEPTKSTPNVSGIEIPETAVIRFWLSGIHTAEEVAQCFFWGPRPETFEVEVSQIVSSRTDLPETEVAVRAPLVSARISMSDFISYNTSHPAANPNFPSRNQHRKILFDALNHS